jgi:transcriptional regulator with XRE-family HTH domain
MTTAHLEQGRIITTLRRAKGLSQSRLAARAGLHSSTLSWAECGRFILSDSQCRKLAKALGVSMKTLRPRASVGARAPVTPQRVIEEQKES